MSIELWLAFLAASTLLLIIPGPTILTVISYSMSHGSRAKIPLIIAVALGDSTALALSLLGIGTVLAQSAFWFQIVKWLGGLYLLYMGLKLIKSGIRPSGLQFAEQALSGSKLFINTYLVTALNPKGIVFFMAFLPQFVSPNYNAAGQLWILAITFVTLATINASLYAIFAGKARELLSHPSAQRIFNITGGTLLSFAGLFALSAKQV